jgi:hypothetical protein
MTDQINDSIIINGKRFAMVGNPLQPWLESHKVSFESRSTANDRGYNSSWVLIQKKLYMVDCHAGFRSRRSARIALPCSKGIVIADWFSGTLVVPIPRVSTNSSYIDDATGDRRSTTNAIALEIAEGQIITEVWIQYTGYIAPVVPDSKSIKSWKNPPQELIDWLYHGDTPPKPTEIRHGTCIKSGDTDTTSPRPVSKNFPRPEIRLQTDTEMVKSVLAAFKTQRYDCRSLYLIGDELLLNDGTRAKVTAYDGYYFTISESDGKRMRLAHGVLEYDERHLYGIGDVVEGQINTIYKAQFNPKNSSSNFKPVTLESWLDVVSYIGKAVAAVVDHDGQQQFLVHNLDEARKIDPFKTTSIHFEQYLNVDPFFPIRNLKITVGILPTTTRTIYFVETIANDGTIHKRPTMRPKEIVDALARVADVINYYALPNQFEKRWDFIGEVGNALRTVLPLKVFEGLMRRLG